LLFPLTAWAAPVTTDFTAGQPAGTNTIVATQGNSANFTLGTSTVTARAGLLTKATGAINFTVSGGRILVVNNRGADEMGLGACLSACSGDGGEIDFSGPNTEELVQISLAAVEAAGFTNFTIDADSATGGEALGVYGSNNSGLLGTFLVNLASADGEQLVAAAQNFTFLNFISANSNGNGDVILHQIGATPAPEPSTLSLLGLGLLGVGAMARRRRRQVSAAPHPR
jgi:hypothetical protein